MDQAATLGDFRVAIIGSGFGGLGMAIQLKRAGVDDFIVLEKAEGLGGTWRDNAYPGAACDVQSHLYSFSFEPGYNWSRQYATQPEILNYLKHCANKYAIKDHIRYRAEVRAADFDADSGRWTLRLSDGRTLSCQFLVAACGQLNRPAWPKIAGLDSFAGTVFHSARWDQSCDLRGKRVAVIGTGASAIQFVPPVAEQARQLTVYQRSAPWVVPKSDKRFAAWQQWLFRRLPGWERLYRMGIYSRIETRALAFVGGRWLLKVYSLLAHQQLRRQVADPALREKLTPDHPVGCKRVLIANDYYPALQRPNVEVVTDAISRIESDALVTEDGEIRKADVVILGTGFRATEFLAPMRITGLNGVDLQSQWRDGAEAFKGVSVSGFPNLFLLYGPNTNLAHNSIVFMLESQMRYSLRCMRLLEQKGMKFFDVETSRQRQYNDKLQRKMRNRVWQEDCQSWYKTEAGKNTNNWPGFTLSYLWLTMWARESDYQFH